MGELKKGCPDEVSLEEYLYRDCGLLSRAKIWSHLVFCPHCRKRLSCLESFSHRLAAIEIEEPPRGSLDAILDAAEGWGMPTPTTLGAEERGEASGAPNLRVRWAFGGIMFVVSILLQVAYGQQYPGLLGGSGLSGLKDFGSFWNALVSGDVWRHAASVLTAIRTDGPSALGILGSTLPSQIAGVLVFGGIVTAVFISQVKASRRRGDGRR